jgi:hypothetical protein
MIIFLITLVLLTLFGSSMAEATFISERTRTRLEEAAGNLLSWKTSLASSLACTLRLILVCALVLRILSRRLVSLFILVLFVLITLLITNLCLSDAVMASPVP